MPRIIDRLLESTCYLYPSVEAAEKGIPGGGSGFFTGVDSQGVHVLYAVTNSHVVRESMGNSPVIRVNDAAGTGFEIIDVPHDAWIHHSAGDDLAIFPIDLSTAYRLNMYPDRAIHWEWCITKDRISDHHIGVGDDVFFVGRFGIHEGVKRNLPTTRFGFLAAPTAEPILNPQTGIQQESFLVEGRSLSGYSGSPAFLLITAGAWRGPNIAIEASTTRIHLLGVDWGHLQNYSRVLGEDKKPLDERWYVRENSAMMGIVPAWKLADLLHEPEVVAMREKEVQGLKDSLKHQTDFVVDTSQDDESTEYERFKEATEQIVSVPKSEIENRKQRD